VLGGAAGGPSKAWLGPARPPVDVACPRAGLLWQRNKHLLAQAEGGALLLLPSHEGGGPEKGEDEEDAPRRARALLAHSLVRVFAANTRGRARVAAEGTREREGISPLLVVLYLVVEGPLVRQDVYALHRSHPRPQALRERQVSLRARQLIRGPRRLHGGGSEGEGNIIISTASFSLRVNR